MTSIGNRLSGQLVGRRIAKQAPASAATAALTPAAGPKGVVAPASSLDGLVRQSLLGKLAADPGIRFGDGSFYLPTLQEVQQILTASRLDRETWMEERFDCDDFAYVLKAEMSVHAYKSGDMKFGLCVGMVWGNFDWVDGYHAVNWFVDNNSTLRFIEPQDDVIHDMEHCQGQISLLLV
jgi:hypothetical protein